MKILVVTMASLKDNSSATIRNISVIKGLAKLGHEIHILTLKPSEDAASYDESLPDVGNLIRRAYYIETSPVYRILRAKRHQNRSSKTGKANCGVKTVMRYMLEKVRYCIKAIYDEVSILDAQKYNLGGLSKLAIDYMQYDIIISTSDPKSSHLIAEQIFEQNDNCSAKWIQYWGDPMLIDITRRSSWKDTLVKHKEKSMIAKADKVVYTSPLTLREQKKLFPEYAYKMDYANQSCFREVNCSSYGRPKKGAPITVGYVGAYKSTVRNIRPLYNVAQTGNLKLNICGASDLMLEETESISIHGSVPYAKARQIEMDSDILVCICNSRGTQIPGKVYYYASHAQPIIVILDGEYATELEEYFQKFNRFILCNNDESSIRAAVIKAENELGKRTYEIPEQLRPENMVRKILSGLL